MRESKVLGIRRREERTRKWDVESWRRASWRVPGLWVSQVCAVEIHWRIMKGRIWKHLVSDGSFFFGASRVPVRFLGSEGKIQGSAFSFLHKCLMWGEIFQPCAAALAPVACSTQVCCTHSLSSRHLLSQQIHHFLASCLLGAAKERCLFLLVKQINADIMHCQRFFCTCKWLLLPLALLNNQLYDYLHFVAHCFLPPHRSNWRRWLNLLLVIPVSWF